MPFADAPPDLTGWTSVISSVSSIGFSGFLVLYLLTKAFPRMQEDADKSRVQGQQEFTNALAAQRAAYVAQLAQQRADLVGADNERRAFYRDSLTAQLAAAKDQMEAVKEAFKTEMARKDDIIKVELAEMSRTQGRLCEAVEELTQAIREKKV